MQLIEIRTIPLEYRLRITNAELRLAEAEKDRKDALKDAYKTLEKNGENINAQETALKPEYVPKSKKSDLQENKTDLRKPDDDDIAVKLAKESDSEAEKADAPQPYAAKIDFEFQNRIPVDRYIDFANHLYEKATGKKPQQFVNIKAEPTRYQKIKEQYLEVVRQLEFVRGEVKMEILTKPRVEVKYIGGFSYVPPSSGPNYEEPFYEKTA